MNTKEKKLDFSLKTIEEGRLNSDMMRSIKGGLIVCSLFFHGECMSYMSCTKFYMFVVDDKFEMCSGVYEEAWEPIIIPQKPNTQQLRVLSQ